MIAKIGFVESVFLRIERFFGWNVTAISVTVFYYDSVLERGFSLKASSVGHIYLTGETNYKGVADLYALDGEISGFGLFF